MARTDLRAVAPLLVTPNMAAATKPPLMVRLEQCKEKGGRPEEWARLRVGGKKANLELKAQCKLHAARNRKRRTGHPEVASGQYLTEVCRPNIKSHGVG